MDRPLAFRPFKRILIVKPSSIGDVIHALPMLAAIRANWPAAHIAWLISPACADIIRGNPLIDEVILFDRKQYGRVGRGLRPTANFVRFLADLRRRRFELVVDAQGLFRSGLLSWATGASARLGFSPAREFAWMFYTHFAREDMRLHAVDRMVALLTRHGVADAGRRFPIEIAPRAEDHADRLLAETGRQRFAALVPGARWETKRWPWRNYAELADRLARDLGLPSVLLGSPDEIEVCEQVRLAGASQPANLCGRTDLQTAAAILRRAEVVVCNDSGASMHMAAAMGKPLVAVFGPTNPRRTGPYGMLDRVVSAGTSCSPCYIRRLRECPYGLRCMSQVSVEQVLARVQAIVGPG